MTKEVIEVCIYSIKDRKENNNMSKWRYRNLLKTKQWKNNEDVKRAYNSCIERNKFFNLCLKELNIELLKIS